MSLLLPSDPSIRSLVDVEALAYRKWVTFAEAKHSAKRQFSADSAIRDIFYQVLRANGDVHLMRFGPRGGKSTVWNFGAA